MPIDNKTITFATNLLPNSDLGYDLGSAQKQWNIFGSLTGNATTATAANITSTANAVAYYTNTNGTFASTDVGLNGEVLIGKGTTNAPAWYKGLSLTGDGSANSPYNATFSNTLQVTGNVGIGAAPRSGENANILYVNGNSEFNGNLIPTVPASTAPIFTLGSSDNSWAGVYIGTSPTYGNAYTPIYWNDGVPTAVATVQQADFTIDEDHNPVEIVKTNIYTENTIVLAIVVKSGVENLNGYISWTSSNNKITLSTAATSGQVIGYILTAPGANLN